MSAEISEKAQKTSFTRSVLSLLLTGLAAVIPMVGTVWLLIVIYKVLLVVGKAIIYSVVHFLDILRGVKFVKDDKGNDVATGDLEAWGDYLFGGTASTWFWSFVPVILCLLLGVAVTKTPGHKLLTLMDRILMGVPIVGFVYSTLKQGVDSFRNLGGAKKFKGVAYVSYPSDGCRLLGFVTGNYRDTQTGKDVTSVFIPTSPNPMTGFVVVIDDDKVFDSDLTVEQASKLILSAGLVGPEVTGKSRYQMRTEKEVKPESPTSQK